MSEEASIVVTCKGRLHHLRRTLPSMLAQCCPFAFEVIVVDFGCPQGTFDWCRGLDVRNLVALKVLDDTDDFHLSRARNCGASVAQGRCLRLAAFALVVADVPRALDLGRLPDDTGAVLDRAAQPGCGGRGRFGVGWDQIA